MRNQIFENIVEKKIDNCFTYNYCIISRFKILKSANEFSANETRNNTSVQKIFKVRNISKLIAASHGNLNKMKIALKFEVGIM